MTSLALLLTLLGHLMSAAAQTTTPAAPDMVFTEPNTALLYGDYASALALYSQVLGDDALKCDALYGLGLTNFRSEQFVEADNAMTRHLTECDPSFRAYALRGEIRQVLGNVEALADYNQAIAYNPGLLDGYLYEQMAAIDPDQSVYYLRLATEAARQPEGKFALREKLAKVYLLIGNDALALAEYDALLQEIDAYLVDLSEVVGASFDRDGSLRARIAVAAASIEIQSNHPDAGFVRLQNVITNFPQTPSAFEALITLVTSAQPIDILLRSQINVYNENYNPVVNLLRDYLNSPDGANAPAELFLLYGISERGIGDMDGALATFTRIQTQFPTDPAAISAMQEEAATYAAMGDPTKATEIYLQLANTFPEAAEAPQALLLAAELARDAGDMVGAVTLYQDLATRYPDSAQAKNGLFEIGKQLMESDPAQAAEFLGQVGSAEAYYRQGQLLQALGDDAAAQTAWANSTAAEPWMFFSMRACEQISGIQPFTFDQTLRLEPITDADRSAAETWVGEIFGVTEVSSQITPELATDPMLVRGTELWSLGIWSDARAEFDAMHKLHRDDPVALLQLAFHYQNIHVYRSSIFAAIRLLSMSGAAVTQIPSAILKLAYPLYYGDLLVQMSDQNELDPLLVASLIRQESSFDATVQSAANARGMMQFIPSTAQQVAGELGLVDFQMVDLGRPIVNLPFGAYYLSSIKAQQNGSIPGAILSYNAGPAAATGWLTAASGDFDRLHEVIEYDETRVYLESIYDNYVVYHFIYGDDVPACMFEGHS